MRLVAQVIKETLSYLRDPDVRISLIVPPMLQILVLSGAATLEVRNVDIAVVDDDAGRASHELVERISSAYFVNEVISAPSPDAITELIDRRKVIAGVHIPADFSRDLAAGRPVQVQAVIDGRRANAGQITANYLDAIARDVGAEFTPTRTNGYVEATVRNWFNENLEYVWFILPAMIGILVMFYSLTITGLSIPRERETGTFDQLLVSPLTPFEIVVAKSVPAFIICTALACAMIAVCVFVFRIPLAGTLWTLLMSIVLFIFSMVGVGLMLGAICNTQQQAILGAFAVGYPMIMVSGFATPVENMPHWLQVLAEGSPLKHFLVILQGSFTKAMPPHDVFANAWPMVVIALITASLAIVIVQRKLQ